MRKIINSASLIQSTRGFIGKLCNFVAKRSAYDKFIYLILAISIIGFITPFTFKSVSAAQGDITSVRIVGDQNHNGWVAEIDIDSFTTGGTYNFGITPESAGSTLSTSAKVKLNVTSPGFDSNGNVTTNTRVVYGTSFLRKPYPNQSSPDESVNNGKLTVKISLSEFIYTSDIVTADISDGFYSQGEHRSSIAQGITVTNNSTNNYPKPVGRWAWAPYERVTTDFPLEATIFHRFSHDAKPLASVKFTCSDQHNNELSKFVNNMTVSTREDSANTGNKVLVYATTMPISNFTAGDIITCNFIAYPWVGEGTSVLNSDLIANGGDGYPQPDERLGPFELLNDKAGTYGTPCVIVSSTGTASDPLTRVYPSCAEAESAYAEDNTTAYSDIGRASQAIKAYNNANYGHNDPGGGTIELQAQNYSVPGIASSTTLGAQKTWLIIKPASNIPCQAPVINANSNNELMSQKLKYMCISTNTTSGNTFKGDKNYNDILWLDRMKLNSTEGAPIRYWKTIYATRNTIEVLPRGFKGIYGSARWPFTLIRGNRYTQLDNSVGSPFEASLQTVIGNKNIRVTGVFNDGTQRQISDNSIYAFNSIVNSNNGTPDINISSSTSTQFTKGIAIVQNVIEAVNSSQPIVAIENMGGTDSINNLIYWHNTMRGQRSNVAYASDGSRCTQSLPYFSNWNWKYNIESNNNRIDEDRSDHGCPADGRRIGNWSMTYMVGGAGNALATGGGPSWSAPDYLGIFTVGNPVNKGFINDRSSITYGGSGGGGGDYHLQANSSLIGIIPAGQAVLPYDLEGNPRYNNGFGSIGVYERTDVNQDDYISPVVNSFIIPVNSTNLTVPIINFVAIDNVGVTGYLVTESATPPAYSDTGWSGIVPTAYTFATTGTKTLYAWAKDASENVSAGVSTTITIEAENTVCTE